MKHKLSPIIIAVLTTVMLVNTLSAQQKRTNWLQEKNEYTGRWRVGVGANIVEPTAVDVQFYRLSKICTSQFAINKKIAIGIWAGMEGLLLGSLIERQNNKTWEKGSIRYGIDAKFYLPIALNPYFGFGIEGGNRTLNNESTFSPDFVARIGLEQKIAGIKLSTRSALNITFFIDGKLNKCLNVDFVYIMPSLGLRFHWI
ncbi:MAG TPA: hypothetical protein PLW22_11600 [Tenuifilum sp.]|mgnify:FL=1|uniref:hypothetical protein n=1 Tax=Tenuifilum sp. TaxID=2760880 RepID=UPI002CF25432|nr:hypothetical protein [Tenuifilum sp.]HQG73528.1 hypothetical protein [Tenuifilum sp.]